MRQQQRLQQLLSNSNLLHESSHHQPQQLLLQQSQQQQQQPNCDIYPYVINNRQAASSGVGLQGLNNAASALNNSPSAQTFGLNNPNSAQMAHGLNHPNSDPLVRALADHGGRVLFTKHNSPRLNTPSGGLHQELNIPSEVEADIFGLHRRLDPDFSEVQKRFLKMKTSEI